jgi:hypothetical protein
VLRYDHVGLASAGGFALVGILAVQKDNDVTILFDAIVEADSICHEIVSS